MSTPALAKALKDVFNTADPIPLQSGDQLCKLHRSTR